GLSQVSTTIPNAAWDAGVQLVEFHPHSYYISRYPVATEATIEDGALDNRRTNTTDTPTLLKHYTEGDEIVMPSRGELRYQVQTITGDRTNVVEPEEREDDSEDCLPQSPQDGFDITVTRVLLQAGAEVDRESYRTHYAASPEVVCTNPDAG